MAASSTDLITDTRNAARPNSARVSSGRSAGGTTLACDNLTGWPTASKVHFVTYSIDSNSNPVAGTQLDCYGIRSGNNITSLVVVDGTDSGNAVNDVVEMLPTAAWGQDLATALTTAHDRLGVHKSGATYAAPNFSGTATGVYTLGGTPTIVSPTITGTPVFPAASVSVASLQFGMVRNRQGGTTGDGSWATTGTSNTDTSGKAVFVQVGAIVSSASGEVTVTFPTAFTQPPAVFLQHTSIGSDTVSTTAITATTTTFLLRAVNSNTGVRVTESFTWLAIGQ